MQIETLRREQEKAQAREHIHAGKQPLSPIEQVEIKLRLPNKEAHDAVAAQLKDSFRETHQQENFFFDGVKGELSSQRVVLRCRFYNKDKRAIVTLKGGQVITEGVGRGSEVEDDVDPMAARDFLEDPSKLLQVDLPFIKDLQKKYNVSELKSLGGFKNVRSDYDWEGFKLELDETKFDWGTVYEIEVETPDPDQLKAKLELFLKSRDIPYKYNTTTKFANFINRKLD
ncbi:hypothetical protein CVIRNUC_006887 [Coccomyxa viridis]|uniref:CYTH domain-containing protein n=1 Tax=Coccomyxa viridis TaxID=1274662 RepID=A0AAV1ICU5_9CHLO|nr:hypothetical protein CVIRNUC_006887 [Coccomyxa viridis]